jgi:hypothetical protein
MTAKNTICLWFDKDAEEAAGFYAATFPDSKVTAVHKAPADFPGGKAGQVLTVDFTVAGIPCLGLNGGPTFKQTEAFSFQIATDSQEERHRRERRSGERMRLVQRSLGPLLADHPAGPLRRAGCRRRRGQACLRGHDDDAKDRRRDDPGGAARVAHQQVRRGPREASPGLGGGDIDRPPLMSELPLAAGRPDLLQRATSTARAAGEDRPWMLGPGLDLTCSWG